MTVQPVSGQGRIRLRAEVAASVLALTDMISADVATEPELFCTQAAHAAAALPADLRAALHHFSRWGSQTGTFLIEGLVATDVPRTPGDNTEHVGAGTPLVRVQAMIGETLGHLVAYEAEGGGRLFQDMVPARAAAERQTSLSSRAELELHTEQAFSPLRPDYLVLCCLRGDPGARTFTLTARQLAARLPADRLRKPLWTTTVDESFRFGDHVFDHGDIRGPLPILSGADDDPFLVFDQDLMEATTSAGRGVLSAITEIYREQRHAHVLRPGEILVIDNNRAVHGRSPFQPRFDGSDRFVVRSFVMTDLARSRYARPGNGRVISARCS
jgi:L-asparagine oxygenase